MRQKYPYTFLSRLQILFNSLVFVEFPVATLGFVGPIIPVGNFT